MPVSVRSHARNDRSTFSFTHALSRMPGTTNLSAVRMRVKTTHRETKSDIFTSKLEVSQRLSSLIFN